MYRIQTLKQQNELIDYLQCNRNLISLQFAFINDDCQNKYTEFQNCLERLRKVFGQNFRIIPDINNIQQQGSNEVKNSLTRLQYNEAYLSWNNQNQLLLNKEQKDEQINFDDVDQFNLQDNNRQQIQQQSNPISQMQQIQPQPQPQSEQISTSKVSNDLDSHSSYVNSSILFKPSEIHDQQSQFYVDRPKHSDRINTGADNYTRNQMNDSNQILDNNNRLSQMFLQNNPKQQFEENHSNLANSLDQFGQSKSIESNITKESALREQSQGQIGTLFKQQSEISENNQKSSQVQETDNISSRFLEPEDLNLDIKPSPSDLITESNCSHQLLQLISTHQVQNYELNHPIILTFLNTVFTNEWKQFLEDNSLESQKNQPNQLKFKLNANYEVIKPKLQQFIDKIIYLQIPLKGDSVICLQNEKFINELISSNRAHLYIDNQTGYLTSMTIEKRELQLIVEYICRMYRGIVINYKRILKITPNSQWQIHAQMTQQFTEKYLKKVIEQFAYNQIFTPMQAYLEFAVEKIVSSEQKDNFIQALSKYLKNQLRSLLLMGIKTNDTQEKANLQKQSQLIIDQKELRIIISIAPEQTDSPSLLIFLGIDEDLKILFNEQLEQTKYDPNQCLENSEIVIKNSSYGFLVDKSQSEKFNTHHYIKYLEQNSLKSHSTQESCYIKTGKYNRSKDIFNILLYIANEKIQQRNQESINILLAELQSQYQGFGQSNSINYTQQIKNQEVQIQHPDSDIINLNLNCTKMFNNSEIYEIKPPFLELFISSNFRFEFSSQFRDQIRFSKIGDAKYRIDYNENWKAQLDLYFQSFYHQNITIDDQSLSAIEKSIYYRQRFQKMQIHCLIYQKNLYLISKLPIPDTVLQLSRARRLILIQFEDINLNLDQNELEGTQIDDIDLTNSRLQYFKKYIVNIQKFSFIEHIEISDNLQSYAIIHLRFVESTDDQTLQLVVTQAIKEELASLLYFQINLLSQNSVLIQKFREYFKFISEQKVQIYTQEKKQQNAITVIGLRKDLFEQFKLIDETRQNRDLLENLQFQFYSQNVLVESQSFDLLKELKSKGFIIEETKGKWLIKVKPNLLSPYDSLIKILIKSNVTGSLIQNEQLLQFNTKDLPPSFDLDYNFK